MATDAPSHALCNFSSRLGPAMIAAELLGRDPEFEREIFLATLPSLDTPYCIPKATDGQFACLVCLDARDKSQDELRRFCRYLMELGCAFFCAWGSDCERVHDAMDREVIGDNPPDTYRGCLMTTWHARESLDEALWFFLNCASPEEAYAPEGCAFSIVISVGSTPWPQRIRGYVAANTSPRPT